MVGNFAAGGGSTGLLNINVAPPPAANDSCSGAFVAVDGSNAFTTENAFAGGDAASCRVGGALATDDVWFSYTATASDRRFSTCGAGDTTLSLYDACGGAEIACDDDGCAAPTVFSSRMIATGLAVGTTYFVRVAEWGASGPGFLTGDLVIDEPPAPCTDLGLPADTVVLEADCTVDGDNDGCNSPFGFGTLPIGCNTDGCRQWYTGHTDTTGSTRDLDWFVITVPDDGFGTPVSVTVGSKAQYPNQILIASADISTPGSCPGLAVLAIATSDACVEATTSATLSPGQYLVVQTTNGLFDGFPCGGGFTQYGLYVEFSDTPCNTDCGGDGCAPCAADYNQDDGVDDLDIAAFFADFEAGEPCADVNNDDGIDDLDISFFFASFEQGC